MKKFITDNWNLCWALAHNVRNFAGRFLWQKDLLILLLVPVILGIALEPVSARQLSPSGTVAQEPNITAGFLRHLPIQRTLQSATDSYSLYADNYYENTADIWFTFSSYPSTVYFSIYSGCGTITPASANPSILPPYNVYTTYTPCEVEGSTVIIKADPLSGDNQYATVYLEPRIDIESAEQYPMGVYTYDADTGEPTSAYVYVTVIPTGAGSVSPSSGWSEYDPLYGEYVFLSTYTAGSYEGRVRVKFRIDNPSPHEDSILIYSYDQTSPTAPLNDIFANATAISGTSGQTAGSNVGATKESGEPSHCGSGGASVWWRWTVPASGQATINTNGSSFDTLLAVYTGSSVTSLTSVDCDDDGGDGTCSLVTFNAASGTTYRIAVDGYNGATGDITLHWSLIVSDTTPPTVTITSPTSNPTYSTNSSLLSIGGTASDNVGVTQVTWSNDRGGSGTCSGTTSWSASGIALYSGQNVITVTARDAANNTGTDTLTVTYTPPDTTPPTVTITSPTNNPTYSTSSSPLSIGGTASDNVGVTQVTWSNDRGGSSGTCSGTTSWSASGITLYSGQNVITVTARDAANNTGTDTLTVTYMTAPVLHEEPNITPGLCNLISWDAASGADAFYAECSSDPCFLSVDYNSGWITRTSYQFCGLAGCQEYWYRVKSGSSAWSQTSQAEFQSDTLIDTTAIISGDVVLVGGSAILFKDDFEDGNYNGWILGSSSCTRMVTNQTAANGTTYSFTQTNAGSAYEGVSYTFPSFVTPEHVTFYVRTASTEASGYVVLVGSDTSHRIVWFYMWNNQIQVYQDKTYGTSCNLLTWYKVDFVFNWQTQTFDFYVNDGLIAGNIPFRDMGVSSLKTIYLFDLFGTQSWWDEIEFSTGSGGGYTPAGDIVSTPINLPAGGNWGIVDFNTTTPPDTELTVDILPATGSTPITGYENVPSGADLGGISATTIRLRANLSTNDPNSTPALHDWSVTYTDPAGIESDWSNIESSIQVTPGDFEPDCDVDWDDLAVLTEQWLLVKLSADVWPDGGDGVINLLDLAVFANAWQSMPSSPNWNLKCDIAPQGGDGIVDISDLAVFTEQWLQFGAYSADIAPLPDGDGIVDFLDFALMAENWMK